VKGAQRTQLLLDVEVRRLARQTTAATFAMRISISTAASSSSSPSTQYLRRAVVEQAVEVVRDNQIAPDLGALLQSASLAIALHERERVAHAQEGQTQHENVVGGQSAAADMIMIGMVMLMMMRHVCSGIG
jgi:hypothetical protein